MIVAMTGHRAEAFRGNDTTRVYDSIRKGLEELEPEVVIQGMAHGVDLWSARIAFDLGIPYVAVRPYAGHMVPEPYKIDYKKALFHAEEVVVVNPDIDYKVWYMHMRNEWMVDHATHVFAIWNGAKKGGTYACLKYAVKQEKPIYRYNVVARKREWLNATEVV